MLLLCVLFNQHSSQALSPAGSNSIIAVALSNQSVAPWLEGSFCRVHNTLPCSTFEWTNRDRSSSGIRSGAYPNVTN
ncbi:MAG TPA: hypothetical protein VKY92_23810 [Verrucomicrobiae bacterium]|nr:hypothetical protein [Verrucomicrobiae bacterium]